MKLENKYDAPRLKMGERIRITVKEDNDRGVSKYKVVTATVVGVYSNHAHLEYHDKIEDLTYYDIWQRRQHMKKWRTLME